MNISLIEKDLWEAADDLRANSKLTATEYAQPILGIIFLSHATSRFYSLKKELLQDHQMASYQKLVDENKMPAEAFEKQLEIAFKARSALYLNPEQRFDYLANLPTGHNLGAELDAIMESIETQNPILRGVLPKTYQHFEENLLERVVRIFNRDTLLNAEGDVFGKIYEYFLNKFAQSGAQEGGEFFTPPSLVRTIVNFIEPDHGLVIDPAVGSAGMFIQTTHFQEQNNTHNPMQFVGQEKTENNQKLAIMNMVVHGLDASNIVEGNSFYSALPDYIGQSDFVMANPPFNVDAVDASKCKNDVYVVPQQEEGKPEPTALEIAQAAIAQKKRLPFGLPGVTSKSGGKRNDGNDAKNEQVSNANSLWIQYFYSYLNQTGRAGFVMPSSASDAGGRDKEIRQKLVETGHVDIMVSIGPKFFYTRSLPCALWFFDKSKPESRKDKVLMLDARNVFTVVSAKSHIFSESQLEALNAIVWLYREEHDKYQNLLRRYIKNMLETIEQMPVVYKDYLSSSKTIVDYVAKFATNTSIDVLNKLSKKEQESEDKPTPITAEQLASLKASALKVQQFLASELAEDAKIVLLEELPSVAELRQKLEDAQDHASIITVFNALQNALSQTQAVFDQLSSTKAEALALVALAESLYAKKDKKQWANKDIAALLNGLNASAEGEPETVQDKVQVLEKTLADRIADITWLNERFPEGVYADVAGLCKLASQDEIKEQDYSLTAGRYVGYSSQNDNIENFIDKVHEIRQNLLNLSCNSFELIKEIDSHLQKFVKDDLINSNVNGSESDLDGWSKIKLSELSVMVGRGISPKYNDENGDSLVINQKCIRDNKISLELARTQDKSIPSNKLIQKGDVLINSTGTGTLGRVAQVHEDIENTTVDTHVTIVRPIESISKSWFGAALSNLEPYIATLGEGATNQQELKRDVVGNIELNVPPAEVQEILESVLKPIYGQMNNILKQNQELEKLREILFPKLISGELDVSKLSSIE